MLSLMTTATESRAALELVSTSAVKVGVSLLQASSGSPESRRLALLNDIPEVIGYFSEGSAALAVDFYEDERERAGVRGGFATGMVINDRTVKIRSGIAWASQPLFDGAEDLASGRLAEVVQLETARPYRDTILDNRRRDPESAGWRRIPNPGACPLCRMLADRGAVYKQSTARFATHPNCHCSAQPVFSTNDTGEEASALQYIASKRKRSPREQAQLRQYLADNY
jgi:hypothetical protein